VYFYKNFNACFMTGKIFFTVISLLSGYLCFGQYPNVLVGNINFPNEPSVMINPKQTNQIVAASNNDSYYYSEDGGYSWQSGTLVSTYGVWGDPVIIVDTNNNFFCLHLSSPPPPGEWIDRIVCQKSTDGGQTWSDLESCKTHQSPGRRLS
jgi:hypothetical protein